MRSRLTAALLLCALLTSGLSCDAREGAETVPMPQVIHLPAPSISGPISLEAALMQRRSLRQFSDQSLGLQEIAQLLWAAQGITEPGRGFRTAPSAGAAFPLEILVAVGDVHGLSAGLYRYRPRGHELEPLVQGDLRSALHRAALNQTPVLQAPATFIISAVPRRTEVRYGQRAMRYVFMEAGHAAQNLCLQAVALDIGTVVIGAFQDTEISVIGKLPTGELPLYLIPTGKP
jgi:SagB-type dehydrogenase family enzyme